MSWVDTAVGALFPPDARSRCGAQVTFSHMLPSEARFVMWWKMWACAPAPQVRRRHFFVFLGFDVSSYHDVGILLPLLSLGVMAKEPKAQTQ